MQKPDSPETWIEAMADGAMIMQLSESCHVLAQRSFHRIIERCRRILQTAKKGRRSTTQEAFLQSVREDCTEAEGETRVLEMLARISASEGGKGQPGISFVTYHKWAEAWHAFMACVLNKFKSV